MSIPITIVVLFAVLVVLLIGRELVCWYWKINEGLRVLREINERLGTKQYGLERDKAIVNLLEEISTRLGPPRGGGQ